MKLQYGLPLLLVASALCLPVQAAVSNANYGPVNTLADFNSKFSSRVSAPGSVRFGPHAETGVRNVATVVLRPGSAAGPAFADIAPLNEAVPTNRPADAVPRWYTFSFFLPTDWPATAEPVTLAHIDANVPGQAAPWALVATGTQLELRISANHRAAGGDDPASADNSLTRTYPVDTLVKGKWYCFAVAADWRSELRRGLTRIWYNNQNEALYEAFNTYNTYAGARHVPRLGLSAHLAPGAAARTLIVDFPRVADGDWPQNMFNASPCKDYPK